MFESEFLRRSSKDDLSLTGFTLIEVMVATAILSFGLVMIFQAFFISLDTFNYYLDNLRVQLWMSEKFWQVQDSFRRLGIFSPSQTSGEFKLGNRNFSWNMDYDSIEPEELYKASLRVSWQEGPRRVNLLTVAYVSNYKSE